MKNILTFIIIFFCLTAFAQSPDLDVRPYFSLTEFEKDFGGSRYCLATLEDADGAAWVYLLESSLYIKVNGHLENFTPFYDRSAGPLGDLRMTFTNRDSPFSKDPFYAGETITRNLGGLFTNEKEVEITLNRYIGPKESKPAHTWTKKLVYKDRCSTPVYTQLKMGFFSRFFYGLAGH